MKRPRRTTPYDQLHPLRMALTMQTSFTPRVAAPAAARRSVACAAAPSPAHAAVATALGLLLTLEQPAMAAVLASGSSSSDAKALAESLEVRERRHCQVALRLLRLLAQLVGRLVGRVCCSQACSVQLATLTAPGRRHSGPAIPDRGSFAEAALLCPVLLRPQ